MAQLLSIIDNSTEIDLEHEPDSIERENERYEFRSSADETKLVSGNTCESEIKQALSFVPGEGKKPFSLLDDTHCEELAHPHFFPTGKFVFKVLQKILSPSKNFNYRLLSFSEKFAVDSDYIFFAH